MADDAPAPQDADATPAPDHPLAEKIRRAVQAHPILRDQKTLIVRVEDRRVHVEGTVFTRDMHRQLVETLARIEGAEEIEFAVEPEIQAPGQHDLVGRVPNVSQGPLPSDPRYSTRRR